MAKTSIKSSKKMTISEIRVKDEVLVRFIQSLGSGQDAVKYLQNQGVGISRTSLTNAFQRGAMSLKSALRLGQCLGAGCKETMEPEDIMQRLEDAMCLFSARRQRVKNVIGSWGNGKVWQYRAHNAADLLAFDQKFDIEFTLGFADNNSDVAIKGTGKFGSNNKVFITIDGKIPDPKEPYVSLQYTRADSRVPDFAFGALVLKQNSPGTKMSGAISAFGLYSQTWVVGTLELTKQAPSTLSETDIKLLDRARPPHEKIG